MLLFGAGGEPRSAIRLAPIVAELELVQVGLEVVRFDGGAGGANQLASEQ